jgi:hypothetical protein
MYAILLTTKWTIHTIIETIIIIIEIIHTIIGTIHIIPYISPD